VPIEGPLKELGLHDVFQLLDLSGKTGELRITSHLRSNEGTVFFDQGAIVFATVRANPRRLGERLVHTGKVTPAELEHARAVQQREGGRRRLGRIFVDAGTLTPRELEREVERQVEEVVFELLSWRDGFFSFTERALEGAPADAFVRLPVERVLMEGARRIDEWSRIEGQVPHLGVVPALAPLDPADQDAAPRLDLRPAEWAVLAEVDGARDLRQISAALHLPEFDVARTVFGLVATDVVVLHDPARRVSAGLGDDAEALMAAAEARIASGDVAAAAEAAEAALALRPEAARGHLVLGRARLAAGRAADAVECAAAPSAWSRSSRTRTGGAGSRSQRRAGSRRRARRGSGGSSWRTARPARSSGRRSPTR
jgi:hypothetical protein